MGAWGGWALAPDTAMGRENRSHIPLVVAGHPDVQATGQFFLTVREGLCRAQAYCAAGLPVSIAAATGGVGDGSSPVCTAFSPAFAPSDAATGVPGTMDASTAANASASPAPNRSSRPGEPRSRAVRVKMA